MILGQFRVHPIAVASTTQMQINRLGSENANRKITINKSALLEDTYLTLPGTWRKDGH